MLREETRAEEGVAAELLTRDAPGDSEGIIVTRLTAQVSRYTLSRVTRRVTQHSCYDTRSGLTEPLMLVISRSSKSAQI